jgi:hypothetical protein
LADVEGYSFIIRFILTICTEAAANKIKEAVGSGQAQKEAKEKAGELKGDAAELAGKAKGKGEEVAGEAKGKAKEVAGEFKS